MVSQREALASRHGSVILTRLPRRRRELLRAWDAADQYLLDELAPPVAPPLIVNDAFGALAVSLAACSPWSRTDSWLARQATCINLAHNGLATDAVRFLHSLEPFAGTVDTVLLRLPRHRAMLEYQLTQLRPLAATGARILMGGMVKHMPAAVWRLAEGIIGPTRTSLARRKARVIEVEYDPGLSPRQMPGLTGYRLAEEGLELLAWPNVFSRGRLDIGTRFFLEHLPRDDFQGELVDLGCGNGLVGLVAARHHRTAQIHFIDESWMAVRSAEENFRRHFPGREARFLWSDGLAEYPPASVDRVLCNPPFHQQQVVGDQIARRLFRQAHRALRRGGELWVVGNRHLGYHKVLGRLFGNCALVASNRKFVVLKSRR
jgi:16S rRNA (guanine1207-N2)-methyltransferase